MMTSLTAAALIFVLRCIDVSLGTLRLILTMQGRRGLASVIGFAEVTVFITAVASVVNGPLDPFRILGYGLGFAAGTWIGMTLDRHLRLGDVVVRVICRCHEELRSALTEAGFGVTLVDARGGRGSAVGLVFTVARRRRLPEILELVGRVDPGAITSVQEVRHQFRGYFAPKRPSPAPLAGLGDLDT